jgi:putative SOS response-associated peptidase YedK
MSRLFAVTRAAEEIATHFGAEKSEDLSVPPETVEGTQGLVVFEHENRRILQSLVWGFPRYSKETRVNGAPPDRIGLVADLTNRMWEKLVVDPRCRCLIPLTHFANPEGEPGKKTRAWFSLLDESLIAWAGFYSNTEQFGLVFAGMTMEANALIMPFNERMPVLLQANEWDRWLHGSIQDVIAFQFRPPMPSAMFGILHSGDRWHSNIPPHDPYSRNRNTMLI